MNAARQHGADADKFSHLIDRALSLMDRGQLPAHPFRQVNASYGHHELCRLCSQSIAPRQVRYQVPGIDGSDLEPMTFHIDCYLAWEAAARGAVGF